MSPTFDALILKCLAKDPKARYADAGALLAALEALPLAAWAEADAEASWRRWENARAALAPAETALPVPSISHIEVALGAERVEDRRAYQATQPVSAPR